MEICMVIPFQTHKEATVAYNSLRIDRDPSRCDVVKELAVEDKYLKVQISSKEVRKLRAAVSSFSDFLVLVVKTIAKFGPIDSTKEELSAFD